MIIECAKCRTKYRFDETQVEEEIGFWVRCTRCGEVFFQLKEGIPNFRRDTERSEEKIDGEGETSNVEQMSDKRNKHRRRFWVVITVFILLFLLVVGIALFVFSPEVGNFVRGVFPPVAFLFEGLTVPKEPAGPAQVRIVELQQRFVPNVWLGNLRVIEGMARNEGKTPLTKIRVKAELFDASGVQVKEGFAYCGNLLTDQELRTLTSEEITRALSNPAGSNFPSTGLTPQSALPFMIIIFGESQGAVTTLVYAVEAERLLQ